MARASRHHAVLVVDVQRAFEPPPAYLKKVERYVKQFPCRIYTQYINPAGSLFRRLLKQRSCAPGSDDTELLLAPEKGDIVLQKIARYGLTTAQLRVLKRRHINRVTVCGLDTDACVLGVMFSLFDEGIECHLKEDMCWSSSGLHAAALKIIREQFPSSR